MIKELETLPPMDRSKWKRVRFGDVVRCVDKSCRDPQAEGLTRVVGLEHLDPGELKITRWADVADGTSFTRIFRAGQVLFGKRRAYQKKAAIADFDGVCSGDILVFEANASDLNPRLLPYIVQTSSFYDHALRTSAGSLSPRTKWKDLASFELLLPSQEEQIRLVGVLESVDLTRDLFKKVLLRLNLLESVLFRTTESGSATLKEICTLITVGIVVQPASYYVREGALALRSLNVLPGEFDLSETVKLSQDGHNKHKKSQLKAGDVVVVRTGRPGDAAVVPPHLEGANCIDLLVVRCGERVSPHYLSAYLNSVVGKRAVTRSSAGTAQQHLNAGELKLLEVPLPSMTEQDALAREFAELRRATETTVAHMSKLLEARRLLASELLESIDV